MSRSRGCGGCESLGEISQTPSAELRNATGNGVTQGESIPEARATHVPAGYKRTEAGVIPEDWDNCTIGDLFAFKNGLNKAKRYFGGGTPIVNYMDVFEHASLTVEAIAGRVRLTPNEIKRYEVIEGDVFFTRTSETNEDIGVAAVMLGSPHNTVFSGFVLRARPRDARLDNGYKQFCFAVRSVRSQIVSSATYTTRALTNGRCLSAVRIAVPPKAEQRAIAAVLSDVDSLIGSLEALISKKRALKRAAAQQLLTGRTRLPGFEGEWETVALDDVATRAAGQWGASRRSDRTPHKGRVVGAGDISPGGRLLGYSERYFSDIQLASASCIVDDVVITASGNGLGKTWLVESRGMVASNFVRLLRTVPNRAYGPYLAYSLRSSTAKERLIEHTATSAYPNLLPSFFGDSWLLLPPLPEQRAIAAVLTDMDVEIASLERRLDKTHALKQGMMQQLLTGAVRLPIPDDELGGESHDA